MQIFRALLKTQEVSERALHLTAKVISLLPSNYNAWYLRRVNLQHLQCDLQKELLYIDKIIQGNEKTYQIWYFQN